MAFPFLDTLFNKDASVRIPVRDGNIYRLEESSPGLCVASSYVDLYLPNGFVIKNDENFRVKNIFNNNVKGFVSKNDFIVVATGDDGLEYYIVELKSRNYKIERVQRQFRTGVAMASYCKRLGIDVVADASRFEKFSVYAVLLTNTVTERRGTSIVFNPVSLSFAKKCDDSVGVCCVNGHSITLEDLRKHAFKVSLDCNECNHFRGIIPYPGGPDDNPT
jgi:hypothetical protein